MDYRYWYMKISYQYTENHEQLLSLAIIYELYTRTYLVYKELTTSVLCSPVEVACPCMPRQGTPGRVSLLGSSNSLADILLSTLNSGGKYCSLARIFRLIGLSFIRMNPTVVSEVPKFTSMVVKPSLKVQTT